MNRRTATRGELLNHKSDSRIPLGFTVKLFLVHEVDISLRRRFPHSELFYLVGDRREQGDRRWYEWSGTYAGAVMTARARAANLC